MAQPRDQTPAATGRSHLRASHADREQVISTLKAAFVQGMLTKDEFDLRVGQSLASRTYADLAALTGDLPAGLAAAKPPQPARAQGGRPVPRPGRWLAVATAVYAGIWAYVLFLSPNGGDNQSFPALIGGGGFCYVMFLLISVLMMADVRQEKRSGRQSPRGSAPGAGGQAPGRLPSAEPATQLPPAGRDLRHTAEAAPSRVPGPPLPTLRPPRRRHARGCGYAIG
jgi:hypothetical protein